MTFKTLSATSFETCFDAKVAAWHFVPKHHLTAHIADTMAPQLNPSHGSCYADEDAVGGAAKLAHRCHRRAVTRARRLATAQMF